MRFLSKIKVDEILPAAIGVAGVVYHALQKHEPDSFLYGKQVGDLFEKGASWLESRSSASRGVEWQKRMQTGQLFAVAALATGALYAKFKGSRKSR